MLAYVCVLVCVCTCVRVYLCSREFEMSNKLITVLIKKADIYSKAQKVKGTELTRS